MQRSKLIVALVILVFFVISFLTNILGPIVPDIIRDFHVSMMMAALLPFAFFIAYGVMSIPAGFFVERWGEKRLMVVAFLAAAVGSVSFAFFHTYEVAAVSLFVIGAGMAILQVAINPLLRVAGGEEHFAFNSAFAQFVFGIASFASPFVYSWLVEDLGSGQSGLAWFAAVIPSSLHWVAIYWLFTLIAVVMAVTIAVVKLPKVKRTEEESAGAIGMYGSLLRKPIVWLFFLSVIAYVGCEQGTADWMSQFLYQYHGIDPHTGGATAVAYFWGLLTAGCFIGMLLLKFFDSRRVLIGFSIGALCMLSLALFGSAGISRIAFPCIGLFASIMWPTIVSLGLNSVSTHHGPLAGILCTGIMGGALVPLLIGGLGDVIGLRGGMMFLYITFGMVLSVGIWARPLISNEVVGDRKKTVASSA
jgi:fucose permease